MENYKVYVEVTVKFSTDGVMMPVEFIWEDGTKYIIDKVKSKERCASRKAGGTGIMYTVLVLCLQYKKMVWIIPYHILTNKVNSLVKLFFQM